MYTDVYIKPGLETLNPKPYQTFNLKASTLNPQPGALPHAAAIPKPETGQQLRQGPWVSLNELNLSYHNTETISCTIELY